MAVAGMPGTGPGYQASAADPTGQSFVQSVNAMFTNMPQKLQQVRQRATTGLTNAYANNNLLASRASLLGGATLALPSAAEAMGEGRTLEAGTTLLGAAGVGALADRLGRGRGTLARVGIQAAGAIAAPLLGQGAGQVAENVKAGITGKDPAGKTSRAATRAQTLKDAEVLAEVQRRFGAAALEPIIAANKDLMQASLDAMYLDNKRNEPLINRLKNADMVRQQALMNTQASNYAMLGTVATAGRLATGAQAEAGANLRTALTSNPYSGSVMQAPNINFG